MSHLLIVESPAKARTINAYLGSDYIVKASMGHIRDLPKNNLGVDVNNRFTPQYQTMPDKEKLVTELIKLSKTCDQVILATDPDREGEAISWHLKEVLGLTDAQTLRVTFNEITKKEVQKAIQNPRGIDLDLVNAQQARRVVDRIVGYEISPILWRKIMTGLSAGRVQSVATRIVIDRENEIRAFVPSEYWSIEITLCRPSGDGKFQAEYFGPQGAKKVELHSQEEAQAILDAIANQEFTVLSVNVQEKKRVPSPPFTTSTLQQEASRKLGMSPRQTMVVAQQLYEGIDVPDHGLTGLITYMRTDSLRLSDDAVTEVRGYISEHYGQQNLPAAPRIFKNKGAAQDAHEAIRPSYVTLPPAAIASSLKPDQLKLYKLIWDRFVSCQMANAVLSTLTIDSVANSHVFRANHTSVTFPGFTSVYEEGKDEEENLESPLPNLQQGEVLRGENLLPEQHFTKPPARFTDASLIKAMEEKGIGRPSTYAPTLSTILDREYVIREQKRLHPTPLGETVNQFLLNQFSNIVDIEFTARMENELDRVEEGSVEWTTMVGEFYSKLEPDLKTAMELTERVEIPREKTDIICDVCGRHMEIRLGKYGRYLTCEGFPDCKNSKPITIPTPGVCPLCDGKVVELKSKRGFKYFGCDKKCGFMSWEKPLATLCPSCGKTLFHLGRKKLDICENPLCPEFVPDTERGYRPKKTEEPKEPAAKKTGTKAASTKEKALATKAKKPAAKKATTTKKKATSTKTTTTAKKATTKKTTTKKTTTKASEATAIPKDL